MKRGWCPSLFDPMPSGDGLVVRIKPRAATLTSAQIHTIADAATHWGNGVIEATLRANLQIRGLSAATTAPFAAAMLDADLADPDPAIERRRNIIASADAAPIAGALERALAEDASLAALPAKFGFLVDGGGVLSPAGAPADIWIRLMGESCEIGVDGARTTVRAHPEQAAAVAIALAHAFLNAANASTPRMRALVEAVGEATLFAGLTPANEPSPSGRGLGEGLSRGRRPHPNPLPEGEGAMVGWLSEDVFGIGLPFGSTTTAAFSALADLAESFADGKLHVTPWRSFALTGARSKAGLASALASLDFICDPADPRLAITACPGRPACASASVDTRTLASTLAGLRHSGSIHVSGCAKGCAHPGPAATTLVGNAGRYDLVRNGSASAPPSRAGLTAAEVIALV